MRSGVTKEVLSELNYDILQDDAMCARLSEDLFQLMRTPEEDFRHIKEQSWYKRIWSQVGGQNLQIIGSGLHSVALAQGLIMDLIRILVMNHAKGISLIQLISDDLERVKTRQGQLIGHLGVIYDEIAALKRNLQYQKTMVVDENELPEEVRVLLIRSMIAAANSDGVVTEEEKYLITQKIDSMELSETARRVILTELTAPTPLQLDIKAIDSHKVRLLLYRNVAAVVVADGIIDSKESMFLDGLARDLAIDKQVSEEIINDFLQMRSVQGLDTLVSAVVSCLDKKVIEELTKIKTEQEAAEAEKFEEMGQRLAEGWMTLTGKLCSYLVNAVREPFQARIEAFNQATEVTDCIRIMDESSIRREMDQAVAQFLDFAGERIDKRLVQVFPHLGNCDGALWSATISKKLRGQATDELTGLFRALTQLTRLGNQVRKHDSSTLSLIAESGLVGAGLGAILTGGLGLIAAVGYGWWKGKQREEEALAAWQAYLKGFESFVDSFDESMERMSQHCWDDGWEYFESVLIPALEEAQVGFEDLQKFERVIDSTQTDIESALQAMANKADPITATPHLPPPMGASVVIDDEACSGCGTCAAIAEDCFALNEETEKAYVTDHSACSEEQIQEAIDTCPEEAIGWQDAPSPKIRTIPAAQSKPKDKKAKYECQVCGYVYDPNVGDPDNAIKIGSTFVTLPSDWICPVCGAEKDDFAVK